MQPRLCCSELEAGGPLTLRCLLLGQSTAVVSLPTVAAVWPQLKACCCFKCAFQLGPGLPLPDIGPG